MQTSFPASVFPNCRCCCLRSLSLLNFLVYIGVYDKGEREEWKSWLKTQHSKNEDHGIKSHHFWQIDGEKVETVTEIIFLVSKINVNGDGSHENKRCLLHWRKDMINLDSILKSRDITLLIKYPHNQSYGFSQHQFSDAQPFLWSNSHICKWLLGKTIALIMWIFYQQSDVSAF